MSGSRPYRIWQGLKNRIYREKNGDYPRYGGRGLTMDPRWLTFEGFWKDMGATYFEKATIDRVDNEVGYWPGNCRWVTNLQQQRNKRNNRRVMYRGRQYTIRHLSEVLGFSRCALTTRLGKGMSAEEAERDYRSRSSTSSTAGLGIGSS